LHKADIRTHERQMIWNAAPGGLHRHSTGGSTGEPLLFYFDRQRQAYDQAARMRTHRWFGADVGQREVYLWGAPVELRRQDRLREWRDRWTNQLLLSAFNMSPRRIDSYLDRIERFDPVSVFGYPSTLAHLARHAARCGRRLNLTRLCAAFVTGETLTPADRQAIADYFGAPVADGYGSRDGGFIAHECPHGGMHLMDESIIVEVLDDECCPVGPGGSGRVVVTHLDSYGMPFIRYETGDLARAADPDEPCACGRGLSRILALQGRQTDLLVSKDGTVRHALSAIYVLREQPQIERYRVVQQRDHSVRVEVVCPDGLDEGLNRTIRDGLQRQLGDDTPIEVIPVPEIPPEESGKYRPVVSVVSSAAAEPLAAGPVGEEAA
jgi:phenylacetate-CoA ligase